MQSTGISSTISIGTYFTTPAQYDQLYVSSHTLPLPRRPNTNWWNLFLTIERFTTSKPFQHSSFIYICTFLYFTITSKILLNRFRVPRTGHNACSARIGLGRLRVKNTLRLYYVYMYVTSIGLKLDNVASSSPLSS